LAPINEKDEAYPALKEQFLRKVHGIFTDFNILHSIRVKLFNILLTIFQPLSLSKIPKSLRLEVTKLLID
jgi:hypothetical protein